MDTLSEKPHFISTKQQNKMKKKTKQINGEKKNLLYFDHLLQYICAAQHSTHIHGRKYRQCNNVKSKIHHRNDLGLVEIEERKKRQQHCFAVVDFSLSHSLSLFSERWQFNTAFE